jgi:hypothetical protein
MHHSPVVRNLFSRAVGEDVLRLGHLHVMRLWMGECGRFGSEGVHEIGVKNRSATGHPGVYDVTETND